MKRILNFIKTKMLMFIFALILPLSATGMALSLYCFSSAKADTDTETYYNSYTDEISVTNGNFNSGSSSYTLSNSISGWSGQNNDKKTTAGTISVGPTFQTYMSSTYHLSKNPNSARTTDKSILMINSQISGSGNYDTARQGYKSNSISLSANSFYSFQVSFKSDTNYVSHTEYDLEGTVTTNDKYFTKSTFESSDKAFLTSGEPVYLSFNYRSSTYYVKKALTAHGTLAADRTNLTTDQLFYEDAHYIGFVDTDDTPIYVLKTNYSDSKVLAGTETYTCDIAYDKSNSRYNIAVGTEYFKARTAYTSLNDYTFGSIYLSGLKDSDGNDVEADFVQISSKEWVTYYIFVATGKDSQNVNLELWLGTKETGHNSSGVVFFDDCRVYQYSPNAFWKKYKTFANKTYTQEVTVGGTTTTEVYDCTTFADLTDSETLDYSTYNFDFEDGEYAGGAQPVNEWTKTGSGYARVFSTNTPEFFKTTTGYDFVGSDMTCTVDLNGGITVSNNDYVLALWAKKNSVKITSKDIDVEANAIYKVKANYKVSSITDGGAYMFVSENNKVLETYALSSTAYAVTGEVASTSLSSNGSNLFVNKYNTVEFYIKGNSLYNSSVNLSLGLGNGTENATGCVLFDNITIERASTVDFGNATNKIALGGEESNPSVANGNFNTVTVEKDSTYPLNAVNWELESSDDYTFAGVINTNQDEYDKYVARYNENALAGVSALENPYYWASYSTNSPKNSFNSTTDVDNVYMLANIQNAWQKLSCTVVSLSAKTTAKFAFNYKTSANINIKVRDSKNITLFESGNITSGGSWRKYEIYLKSFSGSSEVQIVIEFGTKTNKVQGFAYFDNFTFETIEENVFTQKADTALGNEDLFGVADFSDFYFSAQTDDLSENSTGAYTGVSTGDSNHGQIVDIEDLESSDIFKTGETDKKAFYFNNQVVGSYGITSKYNVDLEEGYYKLSFKAKTYFNTPESDLNSKTKYNYGVNVGLNGFNLMKNIRCDEEYETYTIYFHPTESKSTTLYIAFLSDKNETRGSAVVYDIALEKMDDSTEYDSANETIKASGYALNKDRVMIAKAENSSEDDSKDDEKEDETTPSTNETLNWSLIISGAITALAIILAVVFSVLRNIKIKKIEVKRKESYDRKSSLELTAIRKRAEAQQKKDVAEVEKSISQLQTELDRLEKDHKQKVVTLREKDQGKVSKTTDKEFKDFAKKRTVLAEKLTALNEQLANIKSPEYLLGLERKIYTRDEIEKRELSRQSKVQNKQIEKQTKQTQTKKRK